jgi:hypothetical protein
MVVTIKNAVSRWNLYLILCPGAEGWQISNIPILSQPYLASVEMFEIGMDAIIERDKITCYLEYILEEISKEIEGSFEIITPTNQTRGMPIIRFTSWARSKLV